MKYDSDNVCRNGSPSTSKKSPTVHPVKALIFNGKEAAAVSEGGKQNDFGAVLSSSVSPTSVPIVDDDFHFTIELPAQQPQKQPAATPATSDDDTVYLDALISQQYDEELFEVETRSDLDSVYFTNAPAAAPDSPETCPPNVEAATRPTAGSVSTGNHTESHVTIDEAIEQLVSSEPFLSETEMYHLLKSTTYPNFRLTRRTLKKQLRMSGLENSYQRFRAFITG